MARRKPGRRPVHRSLGEGGTRQPAAPTHPSRKSPAHRRKKKIRKVKPLPEITPEEIPFEIPEGWEWCRLGDLTKFVTSGSRGWKAYYANQGSLFIRAQNIKTDLLDLSQTAFVKLPDKMEGQRTRVQPDDILVTITGGNCGKTARVDQQLDEAYVSQHIALTRLMETELSVWIHRCLTTDSGPRGVLLSYSKMVKCEHPIRLMT